jgi:predicted AlkP superfamily pyrophosphatase or phosphodiesterase
MNDSLLRFLGCLLFLLPATATAAEPVKKVLYIGIDGTRFDAIEKADTPNLDALMKDGIHSPTCLILGERYQKNDTISGPGWSSILTGVWADKHGVHDNGFTGDRYKEFPHFFARLKEVRPDVKTASFVTWEPIHSKITSAADVSINYEQKDHGVFDYDRYDTQATDQAVKQLTDSNPDALFLYFGQVDVAGHTHGFHPTVPEYVAAIERADKLVGRAVAAVKARETFAEEDWLILVTSDHGGKGTGHSTGHMVPEILNSFLIVSGPAAKRGTFAEQVYLVDVPVTALAHLGVKAKDEWKLDGRPVGLKAATSGRGPLPKEGGP